MSYTPPTTSELEQIGKLLTAFMRLPFYSKSLPGALVEAVVANVRGGKVLQTYDFVDVVNAPHHFGWQVKSTLFATPVTWKRAMIPNKTELINASHTSEEGRQALGNAIINYCNQHAQASLDRYELQELYYARVIAYEEHVTYFERPLLNSKRGIIFHPDDFEWQWTEERKSSRALQRSFAGFHKTFKTKWFAWHGLSENQLHFTGERHWWPEPTYPYQIRVSKPDPKNKLSFSDLLTLLDRV